MKWSLSVLHLMIQLNWSFIYLHLFGYFWGITWTEFDIFIWKETTYKFHNAAFKTVLQHTFSSSCNLPICSEYYRHKATILFYLVEEIITGNLTFLPRFDDEVYPSDTGDLEAHRTCTRRGSTWHSSQMEWLICGRKKIEKYVIH